MITKQKYVEYLISTPINYTCANLAEHLGGMSHDVVSDFLKRERLTARHLWELVAEQIDDSPGKVTWTRTSATTEHRNERISYNERAPKSYPSPGGRRQPLSEVFVIDGLNTILVESQQVRR